MTSQTRASVLDKSKKSIFFIESMQSQISRLFKSSVLLRVGVITFGLVATLAKAQTETVVPPTQRIVSSNSEPTWQPTPFQKITVELSSLNYFNLRDSGRIDEAYGQFSPLLKASLPLENYRSMVQKFNTEAGKVQQRQVNAITWYENFPKLGSGLKVAVDYSSRFPNLSLNCGYLVWQEQADKSFLILREETNTISNDSMAKLKPGELERLRSQFNC